MRESTWRIHGVVRLAAVAGLLVAGAGCSGKETSGGGGGDLPTTYSISGTVSGAIATGVTVRIQGGTRTARTNAQGRYAIAGLYNGTYVVEASLDGYTFTPATRMVTVNNASVTGQDFTSQPGISIAGAVKTEAGDAHEGVTMTLMGPEPATSTRTATTDVDGNYRFLNVAAGVYLVTPSLAGGWTFHPANALVTVAGTSLNGPDFGSIPATHALSGRVTGALTAGVVVTLSGDADATAVTDGAGNYSFAALPPGAYVVTPSHPGYAFTPAERAATIATANVAGQDFVAAATHTIAGRISGDVLAGVTVSLSGSASAQTTTDAAGYYEFANLVDGDYVVAPSLAGYAFGPASRSIPLVGASFTTADFTASTAAASYTVSGSVSGAVQAGVTITLQGDATWVTTTDVAGAFEFRGVPAGSYLVIPFHDDYLFDPASRFVVVSAADVTGQAFTATVNPTARTIAGAVAGAVTTGVTVTLVGPSPATTSRTTTTDAAGGFAFRGLTDGLYLATPSLAGFAFTPADCLVRVAGPSVTFVQFLSAHARHAISGTISPATGGVVVTLDGGGMPAPTSTTTAADGSYSFAGLLAGEYTVRPSLAGFHFSPVERAVTLDGADVPGVDFVIGPSHAISGHVSLSGGGVLAGVTVTLGGAAEAQTTTDVLGYYEFTGLRDGGYVLTPSLAGYAFDPQFLPTDLAGADITTADFSATLIPTYTVSGTVSGAISLGVTMTLSGPGFHTTTATDGAGAYSFPGVPNGSYMVIPSADGYAFTPASRGFRVNDADVSAQDFTSAAAP